MKDNHPNCKCGMPCEYYGEVGGYSKACPTCNGRNAKRQRESRARKKARADITLEKIIKLANDAGARVEVSLTRGPVKLPGHSVPDKLPERKMPGTPFNRTLLATEASDAEIKKAFKDEPTNLWVITPTRIIPRAVFFADPKKAKPDASPKD